MRARLRANRGFRVAVVSVAAMVLATLRLGAQDPAEPVVGTIHVQGNVYMLAGAGGNIAVQIGNDGVLVVDTGIAEMSDQVIAAIRALTDKPIRWILNTHAHPDHTGGNEAVAQAGATVRGDPAAIIAHENALMRMTKAGLPAVARPQSTYYGATKDLFFNDEAIVMYHHPASHTDTDSIVFFRRSDVVVAGDVYLTTTYPVIDIASGGGVQGVVDSLNRILDITVPKHEQEGGTYVISGHGRIADEADVLEYRDMVIIIRDRVQDMIDRGLTLEQVQAARPTLDYDGWWGADTGFWTTPMFVEAVYRDLSGRTSDKAPEVHD